MDFLFLLGVDVLLFTDIGIKMQIGQEYFFSLAFLFQWILVRLHHPVIFLFGSFISFNIAINHLGVWVMQGNFVPALDAIYC